MNVFVSNRVVFNEIEMDFILKLVGELGSYIWNSLYTNKHFHLNSRVFNKDCDGAIYSVPIESEVMFDAIKEENIVIPIDGYDLIDEILGCQIISEEQSSDIVKVIKPYANEGYFFFIAKEETFWGNEKNIF